jgi:hypothetical protein
MAGDIQKSECPQCGSTTTGALFCKSCGATLRTVVPLIASAEPASEKSGGFWTFSKRDAGWMLFGYVIVFLSFRFDFGGRTHRWFQHPMPTLRAALVAIPLAIVFAAIYKIRFGDKYWKS